MFDERTLSESGDPMFKHNFDVMYSGGKGTAQDSSEAARMSMNPSGHVNDLTQQKLSYGYSYGLNQGIQTQYKSSETTAKVQRGY